MFWICDENCSSFSCWRAVFLQCRGVFYFTQCCARLGRAADSTLQKRNSQFLAMFSNKRQGWVGCWVFHYSRVVCASVILWWTIVLFINCFFFPLLSFSFSFHLFPFPFLLLFFLFRIKIHLSLPMSHFSFLIFSSTNCEGWGSGCVGLSCLC